jgi:hypothetical protein
LNPDKKASILWGEYVNRTYGHDVGKINYYYFKQRFSARMGRSNLVQFWVKFVCGGEGRGGRFVNLDTN